MFLNQEDIAACKVAQDLMSPFHGMNMQSAAGLAVPATARRPDEMV